MNQSKPRQACRYCWHAVETHNLIEGCPHCGCLATPSEARPQNAVQSGTPVIQPGDYKSDDYRRVSRPTPGVQADALDPADYVLFGGEVTDLDGNPLTRRVKAERHGNMVRVVITVEVPR